MRSEAGLGDTGGGLHLAIGILAALVQRQRTGVGQHVEVAQQEAVLNLVRIHLREQYVTGRPVARQGNRSRVAAPSNLYRCRPFGPNDYVVIHCATQEMWRALTRIIGHPGLADDPRFTDRQARARYVDEFDPLIEAWTEKRTKHEAMEVLAGAGIPCGAVLDSGEVLCDPSLLASGMLVTVEHPMRGRFVMPGNPVRLSASPTTVTRAPLLGEHNAEIYGRWLAADEIDELRRDSVI
jgi:formyl-CoA transferase